MNKIVDSQFERVEKALTALTNSISTYNPSPQHAEELVAADNALTAGIAHLSTHQSNISLIASLKNTASALDAEIRDVLLLLTSTRQALLDTSSSTYPEPARPVHYQELLAYAQHISRTTMPPDFRGAASPPPLALEAAEEPQTNGSGTPLPVNGHSNGVPANDAPAAPAQPNTALPDGFQAALDAAANQSTFVPWPKEEDIRRGALAAIQALIDQGIEPRGYDPEEEERKRIEAEEERTRMAEEEKRVQEQMEADRRAEWERRSRDGAAQQGVEGGAGRAAFKLDDFEDED